VRLIPRLLNLNFDAVTGKLSDSKLTGKIKLNVVEFAKAQVCPKKPFIQSAH
jgi:hypothetical protein